MREVAGELRKAVIDAITPLELDETEIPVRDTFFPPNATEASYGGGLCYVLITDQEEAETTNNDCNLRQNVRLIIDIVTKFPMGFGGKKVSEEISDFIQQNITIGNIQIANFEVLNIRKDFSRTIIEQGTSQMAYRKLISYTFDIFES